MQQRIAPHPTTPQPMRPVRSQQAGATTLIVVMVLFFVAALAAAYASRNLIFEQRTSANQYRATQSFEAAEAGLEWALAMLNSGRIDASCQPTTNTSFDSFRQRFLAINSSNGQVTPRFKNLGGFMWAACTLDGGAWTCSCPNSTQSLPNLATGTAAFGVRFEYEDIRKGLTRIEVNGCNGYDLACLTAEATTLAANCNATLCSLAMLSRGMKAVPLAAVTALDSAGAGNGKLAITNGHVQASGITVQSRSITAPMNFVLTSVPGTPAVDSMRGDASEFPGVGPDSTACAASPTCLPMFESLFGMRAAAYQQQPGIVRVDCSSVCDAASVNSALDLGRGRIVWLSGASGLRLASGSDMIGTPTDPVLLVVEGPFTVTANATESLTTRARIYGLVYAKSADISGGRIDGALISATTVFGNGGSSGIPGEVVYSPAILNQLHQTQGSFVRVPGSWRDFP